MSEIINGVFRHYKNGKNYLIIGVALHTETNEQLVIYKPLYKTEHSLFARPYDMFFGDVEYEGKIVKRFEKVSE